MDSKETIGRSDSGKFHRRELSGLTNVFAKKTHGGFISILQNRAVTHSKSAFSQTNTKGKVSKDKKKVASREKSKLSFNKEVIKKYLEGQSKSRSKIQDERKTLQAGNLSSETQSKIRSERAANSQKYQPDFMNKDTGVKP